MTMSRFPFAVSASHRLNDRRYSIFLGLIFLALALYCLDFFEKKDIYELTPFCDADGTCHEKPDRASPRTVYSAKSKAQYKQWWKLHEKLNLSAQAYVKRREQQVKAGVPLNTRPLIFLGDSITESWLGTNMGYPSERAVDVPKVLEEILATRTGSTFDPLVLAIAGDQTQHLLYRIQNGQLLSPYQDDPSSVFVVLIGTNNLGSGELPGPTAKGVIAVAEYILSNTKGSLLLLENLPRGDAFRLPRICPPRCNAGGEPFRSFLPAIEMLNKAVQDENDRLKQTFGSGRLKLLDCGSPFYEHDSASEVKESLMPDLLHPNAAGHRIIANCIMENVHGLQLGEQ
jgi:lysophospholipase L1-like esterase